MSTEQTRLHRRRETVLLSIPMDRCVKNFLDTRLFAALRQRYDVCIISYLSDDPGFRAAYGGDGVTFLSAPRFRSKWRARVFNLVETIRFFGFYFAWRHSIGRVHWKASTLYRYPQDYGCGKVARPRRLRAALFWLVAGVGSTLRLHRLLPPLLGRWYLSAPELDVWMTENRPLAYVATAHRTDQEKFIAFHAGRHSIRSILIPDSWDNFIVDGFQFHLFDQYAAMGPAMIEQLATYHRVGEERVTSLGVPVRRMYEEQVEGSTYDLRAAFDIPPELPIVTYIAVSTMACYDTLEIIEQLAQAVDSGRLPKCVILVRTQPGQDASEYFARLQHFGAIRIQVSGNRGGGGEGAIDVTRQDENVEYAATIHRAAVVVSNVSACVVDACVADVPIVINAVQWSDYPVDGFSPKSVTELDPFGLRQAGVPVAWTMDELLDQVSKSLNDRCHGGEGRRRAADAWDFRRPDYCAAFLGMIAPDPARVTP